MSSTALAPRATARPRYTTRPRTQRPTYTTRPTPRRGQVRLTRRGRLVVLALGVAVALAFGIWLAAGSAATKDAGVAQVEIVTVTPGDTLWGIASDAAAATGESNVGDMVERIKDLNALDTSIVYAGQDLRVPTE